MNSLFHSTFSNFRHMLDEDIHTVIAALGMGKKLDAGGYKCRVCKQVIDRQNVKLIIPTGERIEFVCDRTSCLVEFSLEGP